MRISRSLARVAAIGAAALIPAAMAQDFDACTVFTLEDAKRVLNPPVEPEPVNPKVKRPKMVPVCTYTGTKDGKPQAATATFKVSKNNDEAAKDFEASRLQFQTKPMLMSGAEAFWSSKTGQMYVRKGRTAITLAVGSQKPAEREIDPAKSLAEALVKKL